MSSKQERVNRYAQAVWAAMLERWQGALTDAATAASGDKVAALLNDTGKSLELRQPCTGQPVG